MNLAELLYLIGYLVIFVAEVFAVLRRRRQLREARFVIDVLRRKLTSSQEAAIHNGLNEKERAVLYAQLAEVKEQKDNEKERAALYAQLAEVREQKEDEQYRGPRV